MRRESPVPSARLRLTLQRGRLLRVSAELERLRADETTQSRLTRPPFGWIRYVRDALNMSAGQLARRLHVRQPTIARLEKRERELTITLGTLQRAANALGCDVVYALIPRAPLTEQVEHQVHRAVDAAVQNPNAPQTEREELLRVLLVRMPRWIWGSWDYPELFANGTEAESEVAAAADGRRNDLTG